MKPAPRLLAASALVLAAGCAELSVRRVRQGGEEKYTEGVRFLRPWPHLAVTREKTATGDLVYKTELLMLPDADPDEEYVVEWEAGWFGTVAPNFQLEKGWNLTGFNGKVESGTSAALTSLAALAGAVEKLDPLDHAAPTTDVRPGLYRLNRKKVGDLWVWEVGPAVYTIVEKPGSRAARRGSAESPSARGAGAAARSH